MHDIWSPWHGCVKCSERYDTPMPGREIHFTEERAGTYIIAYHSILIFEETTSLRNTIQGRFCSACHIIRSFFVKLLFDSFIFL